MRRPTLPKRGRLRGDRCERLCSRCVGFWAKAQLGSLPAPPHFADYPLDSCSHDECLLLQDGTFKVVPSFFRVPVFSTETENEL